MTETHLTNKIADEELSIQGYDFQGIDRKQKLGGGCLVYHKESLTIIPKFDINKDENIESVWVELLSHKDFLQGHFIDHKKTL